MNETSPLIPVAQSYGWTSTIPNPMSCKFFDLVKNIQNPRVIDIGAGYGVASIPAMEVGAYVIVNDIDQSQLDHIADLVREKNFQGQCQFLNAALPNLPDILQLDAIHASNVLHFLTGDEIVLAAKWMYRNLKSGGKAFLQMQSPFCGHFQLFYSEYQKRKASGLKWPGEIQNAKCYASSEIRNMTADFNHVLEAEIVADTFREVGFTIEYADYYTRTGLPEVCRFDGRENLGVVVVKN